MSIKRVISGLIGFPIVALVLIFGNQIIIDVAFAVIAAMSFHEYSHAFKVSNKANPLTWLGYLACVTIAFIHAFPKEYLILIIELDYFRNPRKLREPLHKRWVICYN